MLEFLKAIRARYPAPLRIDLAMDNLSTHWTDDIRRWARANRVSLTPAPTYASSHFWALEEFWINNSDYPDHDALQRAILASLDYRNTSRHDPVILKLVHERKDWMTTR